MITKNFKASEFDCNDGTKVPYSLTPYMVELAEALQVIRDEIDMPIKINSAYRPARYNASIGGAKHSLHLLCKASDLITDLKPKELKKVIEKLIKENKIPEGGIGLYKSFLHYDIRGTKARWNG